MDYVLECCAVHESEDVKTATPTSEQVENLGKSGIDSGGTRGTTVMGEEPRHDALLGGVSSTTEIDQNIATDSAKTFSVEEKAGPPKDNLEKSIGLDLEEEPHAPGSRPYEVDWVVKEEGKRKNVAGSIHLPTKSNILIN